MSVFIQCTTPINPGILDGMTGGYKLAGRYVYPDKFAVTDDGLLVYKSDNKHLDRDHLNGLIEMLDTEGHLNLGFAQIRGASVVSIWADKH
jgi:hypothetical protein